MCCGWGPPSQGCGVRWGLPAKDGWLQWNRSISWVADRQLRGALPLSLCASVCSSLSPALCMALGCIPLGWDGGHGGPKLGHW